VAEIVLIGKVKNEMLNPVKKKKAVKNEMKGKQSSARDYFFKK